jgi:aminomethyltransferase
MVEFAGYEMPVQYEDGIIKEHNWTRTSASLFDVSHMGQGKLLGQDIAQKLEKIVPSGFIKLKPNRQKYTVFTNEVGGIIDDLMVANLGDYFSFVVNASRKDLDFAYLQEKLSDECEVVELEDKALLALQGPKAGVVLSKLSPEVSSMKFMDIRWINLERIPCLVSRSGYSGEDGFEISVNARDAETLARKILQFDEVKMAGLGARDTLRLEAGLCLYGNDIDEKTTPVEANISWVIPKRRVEEANFIGADKIVSQIKNGAPKKLIAIEIDGRAPVRAHSKIIDENEQEIGEVTSGGFSPTLGKPIALAYVKIEFAKIDSRLDFLVRGKKIKGTVRELPFVEHKYYRG